MPISLRDLRALIVDLDGVLWRGATPLPGVSDFFNFLSTHGVRFLLATNNAARPTREIMDRLDAMQAPVSPDQLLTSAQATALWLQPRLPAGAPVLLIGEAGLYEAFGATGFRIMRPSDQATDRERAAAVVVGLDRAFTYDKLQRATTEIRNGALFIATNTDATLPTDPETFRGAISLGFCPDLELVKPLCRGAGGLTWKELPKSVRNESLLESTAEGPHFGHTSKSTLSSAPGETIH